MEHSADYQAGYAQAVLDLNNPMKMITENWKASECPKCHEGFGQYEDCDDGYYSRAYSLERCPFCGQKITWD